MLATVLALGPIVFGGGTMVDLARTIADWSNLPTVALVQDGSPVHSFTINLTAVGDGKDLVRLLRAKGHLESSTRGDRVALWDAAWAQGSVSYGMADSPLPKGFSNMKVVDGWIKDGRVSVRAKRTEAIQVADLEKLPWSRPLHVHWFLRRLWIAPVAKSASEESFLDSVAAAVGGRMVRSGKESRIEFDAKAFRPRALSTLARRNWTGDTPALAESNREVATRAWSAVSDAQIDELYERPNQMGAWSKLVGTDLAVAQRRLRALKDFARLLAKGTNRSLLRPETNSVASTTLRRSTSVSSSPSEHLWVGLGLAAD